MQKSLVTFFENYKLFKLDLDLKNSVNSLKNIRLLLNCYKPIKEKLSKINNRDNFNVFNIYKNAWKDETRTHSPFLANIFDINGSHNQGGLFYNELINLLNIEKLNSYKAENLSFYKIETELNIQTGRIDIIINMYNDEHSYTIAIENKIYANDEPKQLERYYNYLEKNYDNYLLIYLTIDQHKPSMPFSINQSIYSSLLKNKKLKLLSYRQISTLLEYTIPQINSENVKNIVTQYQDIIKKELL